MSIFFARALRLAGLAVLLLLGPAAWAQDAEPYIETFDGSDTAIMLNGRFPRHLTSAVLLRRHNVVIISLRPYESSRDLERCLAIWRAASENAHAFLGIDQIQADEEIVRERYMPMAEITVADNGGKIAGFIALLDGFIGGLFVAPEHHRHGIGKKLVLDAASRMGELEVEVYQENSRALLFYGALGFREVSERPLDDMGRPHTLMRLKREAVRSQ